MGFHQRGTGNLYQRAVNPAVKIYLPRSCTEFTLSFTEWKKQCYIVVP